MLILLVTGFALYTIKTGLGKNHRARQ